MAGRCGVSEATVIRFATQAGFEGYTGFIDSLRDEAQANKEMTKIEDVFFFGAHPFLNELRRVAIRLGAIDTAPLMKMVKQMAKSPAVYMIRTKAFIPVAQ